MKGEFENRFQRISKHTDAILAFGVVGLVLLLIIPIPPFFLDALLSLSIIFSVMMLLLTLYVENALEFSSFPSILLFLTLFRLALNIASTRMILAQNRAGEMIQTFGSFIIQESEVVGLILFLLLTVINFLVVTKGASRIAEVAARFTLEALPGKQIAVDSELNSGLISHHQAKEERKKIIEEANFYGAMDGASKFVKGDAIAGLIITAVNIVGGLVIGIVIKKMGWHHCWSTIIRLAIGDGLISQIPALLVSIGAAMMVTRASVGALGKTIPKQIFRQPKVLLITACLLSLLCFLPGVPLKLLIPLSMVLFLGSYLKHKGNRGLTNQKSSEKYKESFLVPPIEIYLGYQALVLVQSLQDRLLELRHKIQIQLGILPPEVRIAEHAELPPQGWVILIKGVKMASGNEANEGVIAATFEELMQLHSYELINRQDVARMLQEVKNYDGAVVEELFPNKLSLGQILKILQYLLKEQIPIRNLVTILEILADHAQGGGSDLEFLAEQVRSGLAGNISDKFFGKTKQAYVITLDPKIEQMLLAAKGNIKPRMSDQLGKALQAMQEKAAKQGVRPIIVTSGSARSHLKRVIEKQLPDLPVLSYKELTKDIELLSIGMVPTEVMI